MGHQALGVEHQPAVLERRRAHALLHALDQHRVLGADLVVELEQVRDPGLVHVRAEEVVEEAPGALGAGRHHRADREVRLARHDVDRHVREEEVELAALDRAARVEVALPRLAHGPVLARERGALLQHVGVHGDVDDLREARVRDLAVVALEVVLAADLPVRVVLGRRAVVEAQRVEVDAGGGDELGQLAEVLGERRGAAVRVDEDERPPGVDRHRQEAELRLVEALLALGARRGAERAVEVVRPGVVGALQRLARPSPSQTSEPRWRQTLTNARSAPSLPRTTTTGTPPASQVKNAPGSATWSARPAYCHARRKIRSRSSRSTAGSTYQSYGSVRPSAIVAIRPTVSRPPMRRRARPRRRPAR